MKNSLFLIFTSPLFYILTALSVAFCGFSFYFQGQFFILGAGSADLKPLFSAIPYIASIAIPLLVERTKNYLQNDNIPVSYLKKLFFSALSVSISFLIAVLLLVFIPISVSFFGDSDFPLFWTQVFGIALFVFSATSFSLLLSVLFDGFQGNFLISIMLSIAVLEAVNFLHLIPLYFSLGTFLSSILKFFSLSWHFDSFSKGIFNFSDILFFVVSAFLFLYLSDIKNFSRKGGKQQKSLFALKISFFILAFFVAFSKPAKQLKIDFSSGKDFSVGKASRELCSKINGNLKITYFCSKELDSFYPQSKNVTDYLETFSSLSEKITFVKKNLTEKDSATLKNYGIKGQPLQITKKNKTESVFVYSAILLEFEGEKELIPFVLGIENLEFDLARHIQHLVFGLQRNVILISGNDFSLENEYSFVEPWLKSRIFNVQSMSVTDFSNFISLLTSPFPENNTALVVLGSKNLTDSQVSAIEKARNLGMNVIATVSKIDADIMGGWTLESIENDNFLRFLDRNGIILEDSVVGDISNVPILMESAESGEENYSNTINFPLWISILPQQHTKSGVTLSWSSPISTFADAKPLLFTTDYAWKKTFNSISDYSSFVNPFTTYRTAKEAGVENSKLCVAATVDKNSETGEGSLTVISDQYFLSSILTGFISSENSSGDFRNFDFVAKELYRVFGDSEIVNLMEKPRKSKALYKINDEEEFLEKRKEALFLSFAFPIFILALFWFAVAFVRKYCFEMFLSFGSLKKVAISSEKSDSCVISAEQSDSCIISPEQSAPCVISSEKSESCVISTERSDPCVISTERSEWRNLFKKYVFLDAALLLFLFSTSIFQSHKNNKNTLQISILRQKDENAVTKIIAKQGADETSIEKKADFWIATDLNDEKKVSVASLSKVKNLLSEMQKVRVLEAVGKSENTKINTGLSSDETVSISFFYGDEKSETVYLGESDTLTKHIYLKSDFLGDEIFETENKFSSFLGASINFWTDHSVFSLLEKVSGYNLGSMTFGEVLPLEPVEAALQKIKSKSIESGFGRVLRLDFYDKDESNYKVIASCIPSPSDNAETKAFLENFRYAFSINKLNGDQL